MGGGPAGHCGIVLGTRLAALLAAVLFGACVLFAANAGAQSLDFTSAPSPDGQMLLEADTLVFDQDRNIVTAVGGVKIEYKGIRVVAQRVSYDRNTRLLTASGHVEVIDQNGTITTADKTVLSDDFRNGFVNALRIETSNKVYFAAESATRSEGTLTTFNNGVYTACAPCEDNPDKPQFWRIKARKIIWNGKTKTVRFESARLEFFGFPIAYLPAFEVADPTVKRKSGFLFPGFQSRTNLGFGVTVPYYLALSPTHDLLFKGTYYTKQGFLGEAEWRQRFNSGGYNLKIAGIHQGDPGSFGAGSVDAAATWRGMVGSEGVFQSNPRWTFGWDVPASVRQGFLVCVWHSRFFGVFAPRRAVSDRRERP